MKANQRAKTERSGNILDCPALFPKQWSGVEIKGEVAKWAAKFLINYSLGHVLQLSVFHHHHEENEASYAVWLHLIVHFVEWLVYINFVRVLKQATQSTSPGSSPRWCIWEMACMTICISCGYVFSNKMYKPVYMESVDVIDACWLVWVLCTKKLMLQQLLLSLGVRTWVRGYACKHSVCCKTSTAFLALHLKVRMQIWK